MSDRTTISDSKRQFHKEFPYVIPPIYRRVADELLVELHLLSHQKHFKADTVFAVGLKEVFDAYTQGYRPVDHLKLLFDALCRSNGLDPNEIRSNSNKALDFARNNSLQEIKNVMHNKGEGTAEKLGSDIKTLTNKQNQYSRITSVGILKILSSAHNSNNEKINVENIIGMVKGISKEYGFTESRVEKDLKVYRSNLDRVNQALELLEETLKKDKKNVSNKSNSPTESKIT